MKNLFLFKTLLLAVLLAVVSGCTITVMHKFDQPPVVVNNYYQGRDESPATVENNTLATNNLGVGYDITRADPGYWSENSVQGVGVRPEVFQFVPNPDPNATIDIPKLKRDPIRRRMPLGVNAETNAKFEWKEEMKFVSNASDFQEMHGGSFSAGGGAMGVAFSASASFKNTQAKTSEQEKTVAYKTGEFRGLQMEIDFSAPQQLSPKFKKAVQDLGTDPANYDAFIKNWGTHFSKVATIGAKCAYTLEFSKEAVGSRYENSQDFSASVSGSMAGVSVEASAGYGEEKQKSIKNATGAENIHFVSYGGSGAGINDFPKWTEDAIDIPVMIDAYLVSYDTLLTKVFFPNDVTIDNKRILFLEALKRYYAEAQKAVDALPKGKELNFKMIPAEFKVEVKRAILKTYPKAIARGTSVKYWGELELMLVNEVGDGVNKFSSPLKFLGSEKPDLSSVTAGFEFVFADYLPEETYQKACTRIFSLSPQQQSTYQISLIGSITLDWWGENPLTNLTRKGDDNSIKLADMAVGQLEEKAVSMTYERNMDEKFEFIVTYIVRRLK